MIVNHTNRSILAVGLGAVLVLSTIGIMILSTTQQDADARQSWWRETYRGIIQNQANVAQIDGDRNDVAQSNAANAEGSGNIEQNQANVAEIEGDDNDVSQSNSANAEGDGDITQNQANVADIGGDGNSVSQSNSASAGGEDDDE
jgi:hypothetical protein